MLIGDALAISIGLDPSQFRKGSAEVSTSLRKTRETAVKEGKQIERSMDGAAEAVDRVARNALKLFAIFTAGRAVKDFVQDITNADSAMGRLAQRIGSTPEAISGLANAVARNGGSADAAAGSFQKLSDSIMDLKTSGNSSALPAFAKLQGLSGKQIRLNTDLTTTFGDLADAAKGTADRAGAPMANYLLRQAGVDQDTAALLVQGRAKLMEALAKSGKVGLVRKEDADAAQHLQSSIETLRQTSESFGRAILTKVTPVIVDLIERFQRWIEANKEWIQSEIIDKVTQFAKALREIPWDEVGKGIRDFIVGANTAAQAVGGWAKVIEGLFALWLGSKFLSVLRAIGLLRLALTGGKLSGGLVSALGVLGTAGIAGILATSAATDAAVPNAEKPGVITRSDDENTGAADAGGMWGAVKRGGRWLYRHGRRMLGGGGADADEGRGGSGIRTRGRRGAAAGDDQGEGYTGNDGRRAAHGRMSTDGAANVASWTDFLQKPVAEGGLGMSKGKAQATIAMMQGESGLNLNPGIEGDKGPDGRYHAHGTAQWSDQNGNPRFPLLRKYATSQGKDWRDRTVQQQYFRMEMLGLPGAVSHNRAYRAMMGAPSDEQTLREGIAGFENPREHALAYAIRKPFLDRLRRNDSGATSKPKPATPTSAPAPAPSAWNGIPAAAAAVASVQAAQAAQIASITNDNRQSSTRTDTTHMHGDVIVNSSASNANDLIGDLKASLKGRAYAMASNSGQA